MICKFRTEVTINRSLWDIGYNTPVMFAGSCFSDNIGEKMEELKFPVLLNPFGVLYNPHSIARSIEMIIQKQTITEHELVKHNNLWHSLCFHGSFSEPSPEKTANLCNQAIVRANDFLKNAAYMIITFGTSWVYRYRQTDEVVANCHKIPGNQFLHERLTVEQITEQWVDILSKLHQFNRGIKIIFTVSPVRHLKDGAHGNQLSKAILLLAVENIIKLLPDEQIVYFPSYELVCDDLRDYRFYDKDMVHISETGIDYIFKKFADSYFNKPVFQLISEIKSVTDAYKHKLLTNDKDTIRKFGEKMRIKAETLSAAFPYINFQLEIDHFRKIENIE